MLLTVDIGNSHIVLGGFTGEQLAFSGRMVTQTHRTDDQYAVEIQQIMQLYGVDPAQIDGCIISSVVPELSAPFQRALEKVIRARPMLLGPGLRTGLNIRIDDPGQLGPDLVAAAVAAIAHYPAPCLIFDLGTAITISAVDRAADFVGCVICAGTRLMLDALTSRTALLPHVSLEAPAAAIGKNSMASMQSGLVYGTAAMLDGLADRMERELGGPATLVATGGLARSIVPHCTHSIVIHDSLLLEGLRLIYEKNRKQKFPGKIRET